MASREHLLFLWEFRKQWCKLLDDIHNKKKALDELDYMIQETKTVSK